MPGLVDKGLIAGLAGMFGWRQVKSLAVMETDNAANLALLESHGGPIPYVMRSTNAQPFQKGINAVSDSWAGHAGMFVGSAQGKRVRQAHPDLLRPRILPEDSWQGKILPPVPASTNDYETIESQALINTNTFTNAICPGNQVVAFFADWTPEEADAILYASYFMYGAPYNIFEIGKFVLPFLPNPRFLKVCSSFVECGLEGENPNIEHAPDNGDMAIAPWFKTQGVDPEVISPGDLGKYLFSGTWYKPVAFNCSLQEAYVKI